tara:strand:- start:18 stop:122 length:105 start_codon:yes stop_codon:yes gene_type:complete
LVILIGCCGGVKNAEPTHRPASMKRVIEADAKAD